MSSEPRVTLEVGGHVATVTLNRPDKHNALDGEMFEGILGAAEQLASMREVRAVVLCGAGRSFCSGLDIGGMLDGDAGMRSITGPLRGPVPNVFQRAAYDWFRLPMPVIVGVHGNCFGGGLQIALGADIRIAAPDAKLSVLEIRWGLIPDMALTCTLPRLIPMDVAKELTYTGRILDGPEAQALGLVTRLADDPVGAAHALAADIAERSPDAVRAAKRLLGDSWTAPPADALRLEADTQLGLLGSPNQLEAVRSGLAKEPAEFADPV
jgi:enoyl-CoA hydratase/carnithine racemase